MRHPLQDAARFIVGSPQRLVEQTLYVAATLSDAFSGAVFLHSGEGRLRLFASIGLDERGLELTREAWKQRGRDLERGEPWISTGPEGGCALLPLRDEDRIVGLMYLACRDSTFASTDSRTRLVEVARIVARALVKAMSLAHAVDPNEHHWHDYLEQTSPDVLAREQLLVLLDRNEWNVARVARIVGVTRRTIYLRMERLKIARQKVRKTRPLLAAT